MKRHSTQSLLLSCLLVLLMPLATAVLALPAPAQAAPAFPPTVATDASTDQNTGDEGDLGITQENQDVNSAAAADPLSIINNLNWLTDETKIIVPPQDEQKVLGYEVDTRVTDYLLYLIQPTELGGAGFDYVKVARIFKNYDTTGVGKFDREGAQEDTSTISDHSRGQAVDISEVGQVTCKVVEHHHFGGDTTLWQRPTPIKVAWQTRAGIANNPTPHGSSVLGSAGDLSANAILTYLNSTGQMDAVPDFVKGMDLKTILTYVGANIYLKNIGATKVVSDPLADSLIHVVGASMLEKALPDLPPGISSANNDDVAQVAIAKARLEQSLGLPPGSLRGYGLNSLLSNTGKRVLEADLGLPSLYLETHPISDLGKLDNAQAILNHVKNGDQALNLLSGTLDRIRANDPQSYQMAGVYAVETAFKLSDTQKAALETATAKKTAPVLVTEGLSTGDQISLDDLRNYISEDKTKQAQSQDALKKAGIDLLQQLVKNNASTQSQGVIGQVLDQLTKQASIKLGDLKTSIGQSTVGQSTDTDPTKKTQIGSNSQINQAIAENLNKDLQLQGGSTLTPTDISNITKSDDSVFKKIGAAEADKAAGWDPGTGLKLMNNQIGLDVAAEQIFAHSIGSVLGLGSTTSISLKGDVAKNYGQAVSESRLGLSAGSLSQSANADALAQKIGQDQFATTFSLPAGRSLAELRANDSFWQESNTQNNLSNIDIRLNAPPGTTESYLRGTSDSSALAKNVGHSNIASIPTQAITSYFDLDDRYQLGNGDLSTLINAVAGKQTTIDPSTGKSTQTDVPFEQNQKALQIIYRLVSRTITSKANFDPDALVTYFTAKPKDQTGILLDQGVKLLIKGIGADQGLSNDEINQLAQSLINGFNGTHDFTHVGGVSTDITQRVLQNFLLNAAHIPLQYRSDADALLNGRFNQVLQELSYNTWQKAVNPYLPATAQLTYQEIRNSFIMDDPNTINARAQANVSSSGTGSVSLDQLTLDDQKAFQENARRQLIDEAQRHAEYKLSDGFLRKSDPTIPSGFTETMFAGDSTQRAQVLEDWGLNHLDTYLHNVNSAYQPGTLKNLLSGSQDAQEQSILNTIVNQTGANFGPFSAATVKGIAALATGSAAQKSSVLSDPKYDSVWSEFDGWLGSSTGVIGLPSGLSRSIFYASQHSWDPNAGTDRIASLTKIGQDVLVNQVSSWGDNTLHLPAGKVYQTYGAIKNVVDASRALPATGTASYSAASAKLTKAQGALAVLLIETALSVCEACQQLFGSVDRAIAAPAGFTNAAVAGAISMAFGLGPAGLYVAAAIYLFGAYSSEFLCPIPPPDKFSVDGLDQPADQLQYQWGSSYDKPNAELKDDPPPGGNKFSWGDSVSFADGNSPDLWMAWARYFSGKLLDATFAYGQLEGRPNSPKQVITYRKANVEHFTPLAVSAFGPQAASDPGVGIGYTETTTKTTDWIHTAFGGLF